MFKVNPDPEPFSENPAEKGGYNCSDCHRTFLTKKVKRNHRRYCQVTNFYKYIYLQNLLSPW